MNKITVEVAFATPFRQCIVSLQVSPDTSILEVIKLSNIKNEFKCEFPIIDEHLNLIPPIGIFGKRILDVNKYKLQHKDRIEIYRPLNKSPNQKRLERQSRTAK